MDKRIEYFGIKGNKVSFKSPDYCYHCGSEKIAGVEVIGAYDGVLLWECVSCGENMLRFSEKETEKLLENAPSIEIEDHEWEKAWQGLPN